MLQLGGFVYKANCAKESKLRELYLLEYNDPHFPQDKERIVASVADILAWVNADRGPDWLDYDETEWQEGLETWTYYKVVRSVNLNVKTIHN